MTVSTTLLHAHPQTRIATLIHDRLVRCHDAKIVSGFATPDGINAVLSKATARKISSLVLGAATFKAFEALDHLITAGLPTSAARVHLGHTRRTGGKKNPFVSLRPMLHSKIYLFHMPDGTSSAIVGSHNMTGFALRGLNGEASILIEGDTSEAIFSDISAHIAESFKQAVPYDTTLKEDYARWYAEYLDKLRIDTTDMPRDSESRRTIILFAQQVPGPLPRVGEQVYFELDKRLETLRAIETDVHLYLFSSLPASPRLALAAVAGATKSFVASVEAIDSGARSAEVNADWFVDNSRQPVLKSTVRPFRPTLTLGKQQVRASIRPGHVDGYDYLFEEDKIRLEPILGTEPLSGGEGDQEWSPVVGFGIAEQLFADAPRQIELLAEMSPDSGSYILFSKRRRRR